MSDPQDHPKKTLERATARTRPEIVARSTTLRPEDMQQIKLRLIEYDDEQDRPKAVFMALTSYQYDELLENLGAALQRFSDKVVHHVDSGTVTPEDFTKARATFLAQYPPAATGLGARA